MKRINLFIALLSVAAVVATGCSGGGGGDDGVKSEVSQEMSQANELAKRVDGKFDKLTAAEKDKMIKQFGSEATARSEINLMAHPPNLQHKPQ